MRDKLKNLDYFNYAISYYENDVIKLNTYIEEKNPQIPYWSRIYSSLELDLLALFRLKYSTGEAKKSELKKLASDAIKYYCLSQNTHDGDEEKDLFSDYIGVLEDGIDLLSLTIIFDLKELQQELIDTFKNTKGKDCIIESFVNLVNPSTKISNKSKFEKQYGELKILIESKENHNIKNIKNYLDNWYKSKRISPWYNTHKTAQINGATNYYGYWSLESVALVKLFKLDKASLKDIDYFPFDLI